MGGEKGWEKRRKKVRRERREKEQEAKARMIHFILPRCKLIYFSTFIPRMVTQECTEGRKRGEDAKSGDKVERMTRRESEYTDTVGISGP